MVIGSSLSKSSIDCIFYHIDFIIRLIINFNNAMNNTATVNDILETLKIKKASKLKMRLI